jgi:mxaJ protein
MRRDATAVLAAAVVAATLVTTSPAFALRVCSDPDYMPYSNSAGQGFENHVAAFVARHLGEKLTYYWESQRGHGGFDQFLFDTLKAKKCDLIIDIPYASDEALTTSPYYVSSYVFVYKKSKKLDIGSMDSADLIGRKIGFEEDTPPEDGLKLRGLAVGSKAFNIAGVNGTSPKTILDAVQSGRIDVAITWEPSVGYFLRTMPDFVVHSVPNGRTRGAPEQYSFPMSMGVREHDEALRRRIDRVIEAHKSELAALLVQDGVRLYPAGANVYGP